MPAPESFEESTGRRAAILQAAKGALLERGVDGVSMDDVAQRAGTTKRTVYAHMRTKKALVDAVVDESTRRFVAGLPEPAALHTDPVEAVVRYAECVETLLGCQDPIRLQRMVLGEQWRHPEYSRQLLGVFERAEQRLADFLSQHGCDHPERAAGVLLAALVSRDHLRTLFGERPVDATPEVTLAKPSEHDRAWRLTLVRALLPDLG